MLVESLPEIPFLIQEHGDVNVAWIEMERIWKHWHIFLYNDFRIYLLEFRVLRSIYDYASVIRRMVKQIWMHRSLFKILNYVCCLISQPNDVKRIWKHWSLIKSLHGAYTKRNWSGCIKNLRLLRSLRNLRFARTYVAFLVRECKA